MVNRVADGKSNVVGLTNCTTTGMPATCPVDPTTWTARP